MTVAGPLPEPLDSVVAWVPCVAGGLPAERYAALLDAGGFATDGPEDRGGDLEAMIRQARRRLALVQAAAATGVADLAAAGFGADALGALQGLLGIALDCVRAGTLGYVLVTATRRPA